MNSSQVYDPLLGGTYNKQTMLYLPSMKVENNLYRWEAGEEGYVKVGRLLLMM